MLPEVPFRIGSYKMMGGFAISLLILILSNVAGEKAHSCANKNGMKYIHGLITLSALMCGLTLTCAIKDDPSSDHTEHSLCGLVVLKSAVLIVSLAMLILSAGFYSSCGDVNDVTTVSVMLLVMTSGLTTLSGGVIGYEYYKNRTPSSNFVMRPGGEDFENAEHLYKTLTGQN